MKSKFRHFDTIPDTMDYKEYATMADVFKKSAKSLEYRRKYKDGDTYYIGSKKIKVYQIGRMRYHIACNDLF